jgi:hypothetical protein
VLSGNADMTDKRQTAYLEQALQGMPARRASPSRRQMAKTRRWPSAGWRTVLT